MRVAGIRIHYVKIVKHGQQKAEKPEKCLMNWRTLRNLVLEAVWKYVGQALEHLVRRLRKHFARERSAAVLRIQHTHVYNFGIGV